MVTTTIKGNVVTRHDALKGFDSEVEVLLNGKSEELNLIPAERIYVPFRVNLNGLEVRVGPRTCVTKDPNIDDFVARCSIVRGAVANIIVPSEVIPLEPIQNPLRSSSSDSDDGVNVVDEATDNPFSPEEFVVLKTAYEKLHSSFHQAIKTDFQNAYGKFFFQGFGDLVRLIKGTGSNLQCLHSTNPNGEYQPGSLKLKWKTLAPTTRSNVDDSLKFTSSHQDRVADFTVWDPEKKNVYNSRGNQIERRPTRNFSDTGTDDWLVPEAQTIMLGLMVWPTAIEPLILSRSDDGKNLEFFRIRCSAVGYAKTLKQVLALVK